MPNDAKLGLVVGVGLVITVAVVFFRKDVPIKPSSEKTAVTPVNPSVLPPPAAPSRQLRPTKAKTAALIEHIVQEGETLSSLAERYYGDRSKSADIRRVNQGPLKTADQLTPGTVLVIPELASGGCEPPDPEPTTNPPD